MKHSIAALKNRIDQRKKLEGLVESQREKSDKFEMIAEIIAKSSEECNCTADMVCEFAACFGLQWSKGDDLKGMIMSQCIEK